MDINPEIFKAYDIRGIYPSELTEDSAFRIGKAIVSFIKAKKICIGMDIRTSSQSLYDSIVDGMTSQGADVTNIGICSTPMLYFCVSKRNFDAGVMVTASHNPKEYNGIKITRENSVFIGENNGLMEIKELAMKNSFPSLKKGKITIDDTILKDYKEFILKNSSGLKKLKVVVDAGNSVMGPIVSEIFSSLPVKLIPMYFEYDGNFPNHQANPTDFETLKEIKKRVVEEHADMGIAFDGDGDRVFFIDNTGEIIPSNLTAAIIAKNTLKIHPGSNILYDLRASWMLKEEIEKAGGKGFRIRVGRPFVQHEMRNKNASFGIELSGHFFFRENYNTESAILASMRMMQEASRQKLSDAILPLKRYFSSGEINSTVKNKTIVLEKIEEHFKDYEILHIDGVSVETDLFWFNVRESNTEPVIRLNCEAKTKDTMEEIRDKILNIIKDN